MSKKIFKIIGLLLVVGLLVVALPIEQVIAADQCVNPGGTDGCLATIQAAIDAASPGDTVTIANGTYAGSLNIYKNLTLRGESEVGVIIDTSGLNDYGIDVDGDLTTYFSNFTLIGPAPSTYGYGLKVSGENALTTIQHVTVKNSGRSGIDLNGLNGVLVDDVTLIDNGGVGLALTDSSNLTVSNITTSGNAWGGMAIYVAGESYTGGSENITLTGTNSFAEPVKLYIEEENDFSVTNFTQSDFGFTVENEIDAPGSTGFFVTQAEAIAAALYSTNRVASVITNLTSDSYYVVPGMSIQAAHDAADPGDTIIVADGTYTVATEPVATVGLVNIYKQITIKAEEDGNSIRPVIDASGRDGVFKIHANALSGGQIVIEGFDLTGDKANTGTAITVMYCGGTPPTNIIIRDNLIHGMIAGINAWGSDYWCPVGTDYKIYGLEITENDFYELGYAGIEAGRGFGVAIQGLSDSTEAGGYAAIVSGNTFEDIHPGLPADLGVGIAFMSGAANAEVIDNIFIDNIGIDIALQETDVLTTNIYDNDLSGGTYGVAEVSTTNGPADASPNWWGTAVEASITSRIMGSVIYDPWWVNTEMTILSSTLPAVVYVDDGYDYDKESCGAYICGYNAFETIQEGIDGVAVGGTVNVAAGMYDEENILISKGLSLLGDGSTSTFIAPSAVTNNSTIKVQDPTGNVLIDGFTFTMQPKVNYGSAIAVTGNSIAIDSATVTISNNIVNGSDDGSKSDYGFYGQGNNAKVVITENVINKTGDNPIVFEQQAGSTAVYDNDFYITANPDYNPYFSMAYSGLNVSTPQIVEGNTFHLDHSGTGYAEAITFSTAVLNPWSGITTDTGHYSNIQIKNNFIYTEGASARGIGLSDRSSTDGFGTITGAIITGNQIIGESPTGVETYGVTLNGDIEGTLIGNNSISQVNLGVWYKLGSNSVCPTNTDLYKNQLVDLGISVKNDCSVETDASPNWWGQATGPGAGQISGDVDYIPWCTNVECKTFGAPVINITQGTYFATIQEAINDTATVTGDVISVSEGIHTGPITINKSVTLLGPNAEINPITGTRGAEAILQGTTTIGLSEKVDIDAENVVIKGFTFDNLRIDNYNGQGTNTLLINGIVVENNIFSNVLGTAIYLRDGRDAPGLYSSSVQIKNNLIDSPGSAGAVDYNAGSGIILFGAENSTISGNEIISAAYNGIQLARINAITVAGNIATGAAQPALQIAQWNDGTNTIEGNTFSTLSTEKAAIRLYGFTNEYYPVFNFTNNTIQDSTFAVQIGHGDAGKGYNDILDADYSFSGNTYTNISSYRLVVYLATEATSAELTEINTLISQVYAPDNVATLITSSDPYTYVVAPCTTACYVSTTGSDANLGTEAFPFLTIQKAINSVTPDGTVYVAAGIYDEDVDVNKSVSIIGAGATQTYVTQPATAAVFTISANDVSINNLAITDPVQVTEAIRVSGATSGLVVENVDIGKLGAGTGANAYGINFANAFANLTVTNTKFIGMDPGTYTRAMGIYMPKSGNATNFSVTYSTFKYVFTGVDIRSNMDQITISNNTFGPMDSNDCTAAASGIYFGDGPTPGFSIDDVSITDNDFVSYCRGVYIWDYADDGIIGALDISENTFTDSIYSSAIRIMADWTTDVAHATPLTGPVTISDNDFIQSAAIPGNSAGVAMIDIRVTDLDSPNAVSITDNNITFSGTFIESTYGVLVRGPITDLDITGNVIDGGGAGGASAGIPPTSGIVIASDFDYFGGIPTSATIDISENTIKNLTNGISVYDFVTDTYGGLADDVDFTVNLNNITDNTIGLAYGDGETIDATGNWWGDDAGPAEGQITGDVSFCGWLIEPYVEGVAPIAVAKPVINTISLEGFCTIQAAIDDPETLNGHTINVAAGTYVENVVVNKAVEIEGAGQTSTIIIPAISNPTGGAGSIYPGSSNVILVEVDNVSIHDLTIDGDNPDLTSDYDLGGANVDARNGIITNHALGTIDGLEVSYVTVKNIYLRGIYASSGGTFNIHHNTVTNVQGESASVGIMNWVGMGTIANNTVSYANDAISANYSSGTQFLNNIITNSGSGIHTDNASGALGATDVISGNSVDCTGVSGGYGIFTFVNYLPISVEDNIVNSCEIAYSAWGGGFGTTELVEFNDNTATAPSPNTGSVGIYITTDTIGYGYTNVNANFTDNTLTGFDYGIQITADQQSWNPEPYEEKTITSTILHNNIIGSTSMAVYQGTDGTYNVDLEENWWGSILGPQAPISDAVDVIQWCGTANPTCLPLMPVDNAITLTGTEVLGDANIYVPNLTINIADGATIANDGACFNINASYTTIQAESKLGAICKPASGSNGINVADDLLNIVILNLAFDGSDGGVDGIHFDGGISDIMIADNWFHDLTDDAIEFTEQPTLPDPVNGTPIISIQGNLFEENGGFGINAYTFTVPAEFNSWGHVDGADAGDGKTTGVDADPYTHVDLYVGASGVVSVGGDVTITIYGNLENVMGANFTLHYDPNSLDLDDTSLADLSDFVPGTLGMFTINETAGTITFDGTIEEGGTAISGEAIPIFSATFEVFTSGAVLSLDETTDSFFMLPATDPAPSTNIYALKLVGGELTDTCYIVTGTISMQGRSIKNGIPATLTGLTLYGPYTATTNNNLSNNLSFACVAPGTYTFTTNQPRYLNVAGGTYGVTKTIEITADKILPSLRLIAGNAVWSSSNPMANNRIGIDDSSKVGACYLSVFDQNYITCPLDQTYYDADVNFDGKVNILDLTIVGGNFYKTSATEYGSWTP